jgi:hypothetical protein
MDFNLKQNSTDDEEYNYMTDFSKIFLGFSLSVCIIYTTLSVVLLTKTMKYMDSFSKRIVIIYNFGFFSKQD